MGRGDGGAALAELDVVLARAQDKDLRYLALLFQGRVRTRQGRSREALEAYTAAIAVDERWQTARLALSQARWRLGDLQGAREALQPIVAPEPVRAESMDPWWLYPWVQGWRPDALFEALRQEVSR
jgi:tetratricopeptide (TPR) repeat protein